MPGSFDYSPGSSQLGGQSTPTAVFLYDGGGLLALPNVQVWNVSFSESDDPPTARFGYVMDDRAVVLGWPTQFDQLWPLARQDDNGTSPYVVMPDDRIVVYVSSPDGSTDILFDGYARLPQVDLGPSEQAVSFSAVGVAIRCYDIPIQGRIQRNGGLRQVQVTDGSEDVPTNLPTRFNPVDESHPSGQPNCTPNNFDSDPDGDGQGVAYPVFLDPNIDRPGDAAHSPSPWTLSDAIKYLLAVYNPGGSPPPEDGDDPEAATFDSFVKNPDFGNLTALLDGFSPKDPTGFFDPNDPSTYTVNPIIVRDFDCTNMAWPEAVSRLMGYHGFGMRWILGEDGDGAPTNSFEVYRKDAANPGNPKVLYLPPNATPITPSNSNVGNLKASFDYHALFNSVLVETHPNRYEISVILPPLFTPSGGDSDSDIRPSFWKSKLDNASEAVRAAYRNYGVDELGDGYYDLKQDKWVTGKPFDFSRLWPSATDPDTGEDIPGYVVRLRKAIRECLTDDGDGDNLPAQLALSRNYKGVVRGFWDGTGDWQPIKGDWKLSEDSLGIEFTADDPEAIHCGKSKFAAQTQNSGSILKGVKSIADPGETTVNGKLNTTNSQFYLRLTCVIQGDATIEASAPKRMASPVAHEIRRRIDAKGHFLKDTIHKSSAFYSDNNAVNPGMPTDDDGNLLPRDDTKAATAYAAQLRATHEFPTVPMAVTIPGVTLAYSVGDRLGGISGRNISFQTNGGTEQQEAPAFPFVVACSWDFSGDQQSTSLMLSDRRMEPQPLEHRRGR